MGFPLRFSNRPVPVRSQRGFLLYFSATPLYSRWRAGTGVVSAVVVSTAGVSAEGVSMGARPSFYAAMPGAI